VEICERRRAGLLVPAIAREFHVSTRTVESVLREAKVEGDLRDAALTALLWLESAKFDYRSGRADSTGIHDEGYVRGWEGHHKVTKKLYDALGIEDKVALRKVADVVTDHNDE